MGVHICLPSNTPQLNVIREDLELPKVDSQQSITLVHTSQVQLPQDHINPTTLKGVVGSEPPRSCMSAGRGSNVFAKQHAAAERHQIGLALLKLTESNA